MLYNFVIKFPYVLEYKLFEAVDVMEAEELLAEYNDFYMYNLTQIERAVAYSDDFVETDETEEDRQKRAEHNAAAAAQHFKELMGSKDFAESSLVGLRIDYYSLQQILLEEYKTKTPINQSALNEIAPQLRTIASLLLFAHRIVAGLEKLTVDLAGLDETQQTRARNTNDKVLLATEFAKEGFSLLVERLQTQKLDIPEYNKTKKEFKKIKSIEAHIDFCEKLFFVN